MTLEDVSRRAFVKAAGSAVSGAALLPACVPAEPTWRFFSAAEARVIDAITEQIIPPDQDAGARDAGVVHYIDRQLAQVFSEHQQIYRAGIVGVQQTSNLMFGGDFESLAWSEQTAVLEALERGDPPGQDWESVSPRAFFALVRDHTMQGFYGSPRHGGNRDFVSFRMIGLDYPRIVGQNRYTMYPGGS